MADSFICSSYISIQFMFISHEQHIENGFWLCWKFIFCSSPFFSFCYQKMKINFGSSKIKRRKGSILSTLKVWRADKIVAIVQHTEHIHTIVFQFNFTPFFCSSNCKYLWMNRQRHICTLYCGRRCYFTIYPKIN